jgi:oligopeptide/dipeptide ABC transporter ATP-binding protein
MNNNDILLEVKDLKTHFFLDEGTVKAVDGVDFSVKRSTTIGIVGESGCGKSVTAFSILKLVTRPGRMVSGEILFHPTPEETVNIAELGDRSAEIRSIRGKDIAMIFQEPMNSLSPVHTIGFQIRQSILLHIKDVSKHEARKRAIKLLDQVGIPKAAERYDAYTFQLSGGMRQRAMIAMALACNPQLLIADEPTTALDVTTQAQILELMLSLQQEFGMGVMLITHDLGVVAETCEEVVVMYLGEVVEQAPIRALFKDPLHPYTQALLRSIPRLGLGKKQELNPIEGAVPDPFARPTGCPFHTRCEQVIRGYCEHVHPDLITLADGRTVRCHLYSETPAQIPAVEEEVR